MNEIELGRLRVELLRAAIKKTTTCTKARPDGNQTEFGKLLGYKDGAHVRQMLSGERPVSEKTIRLIEDLPGMAGWFTGRPEFASAGAPGAVQHIYPGSGASINAPKGPMFKELPKKTGDMLGNNDISPRLETHGKLPLISWTQARTWDTLVETFAQEDAEDWLECPVPHSIRSYCVQNVSDGMDDGTSEGYREGEILFVDPEVAAMPGDDVIVNTSDDKTIFRRLKEDTEGLYLLGLNGKKIMRIPEGANICGVVIFSGVRRKRRA
jgi:SOS-response transcriptional repressor LexA